MAAIEGYNIAFKLGGKTIEGRTQDDLTVAARIKESLTKDDQGETQVSVSGHDITFRASGVLVAADGTNTMGRNTMLADALKKGSAAILTFLYMGTDLTSYTGSCIITNYTESSNASDDATWTADFRVSGEMTVQS